MYFLGLIDTYKSLSPSIKSTLVIVILLSVFAVIIGKKAEKQDPNKPPKGLLLLAEMLVSWINDMCEEIIGSRYRRFAPFILTFVMIIFVSNIFGLFGFHPPTANVEVTVALGFLACLVIHIGSIKAQGVKKWLRGFLDPMPLMLPLNIVSELVTPFSLGMRLFGNILSGVVIMSLLYNTLPNIAVAGLPIGLVVTPIVTPAFHAVFDVFFGAIQAYVFVVLTIVFISGKLPEEE